MSKKKVLIAHQSTIPHYRVPFYEAVERLRPQWWDFSVVYDPREARDKSFLEFDHSSVSFQIKHSRTFNFKLAGKQVCFQSFPFEGSKYDLLVMGSQLSNISYPLSFFWRFGGKAVAYWGHGRDLSVEDPQGVKAIAERTKIWLSRRADGFFAYTNRVRDYMVNNGVEPSKIFVLQNTIDIAGQRRLFEKLFPERETLRLKAGLQGKKVLLFVGRLTREKQPGFLLDAFKILTALDKAYHLIIVGGGDTGLVQDLKRQLGDDSFRYVGAREDISEFCTISDLYVLPGAIGLGPLHALCFELTPVVVHSRFHKPEYEYLNSENALILPERSTAEQYAFAINSLLEDRARWSTLRAHAWPSIKHLTIENMAQSFIDGVSSIFKSQNGKGPNVFVKWNR